MTPEHEQHMQESLARFQALAAYKYRKGAEEHGGRLWEKLDNIREAKNEIIDLWFYLDAEEERTRLNDNTDIR